MPDGLVPAAAPALPLSADDLARWFGDRLGIPDIRVTGIKLLPGGAIQHNWRIDLEVDGATQGYVLRAGPDVPLPESRAKSAEFATLRAAYDAGVPVPEPLWCHDGAAPFFVSRLCDGDARRENLVARADNAALLRDLGVALSAIHGLRPAADVCLESPAFRIATLQAWTGALHGVPAEIASGLDSGFAWLDAHAPAPAPAAATLVHRDFRTGNFLVAGTRLRAVLDWEFAGWGDPHEDIGWFCAACWRGDAPAREAGGLGDRRLFYRAYMESGGAQPNPARVRFWEVFAHMRWAVIALQQGARARAGAHPAWELEEAEARVPGLLNAVADMIR